MREDEGQNELNGWKDLQGILDDEGAESSELLEAVRALPSDEVAYSISKLSSEHCRKLVSNLPAEDAAQLVSDLGESQAARVVVNLEIETAAAVLGNLQAGHRADVLDELPEAFVEKVLKQLPRETAEEERLRRGFEEGSAGELMSREFVSFPVSTLITEVIRDLRAHVDDYSDFAVQYVYGVGEDGELLGVLRLRDILLAPDTATARDVMISDPLSVPCDSDLEKLVGVFRETTFLGVPVVDDGGKLLGVLRRGRVDAENLRRDGRAFLKTSGIVGGEELRSMPLLLRSLRRLSWLAPNIVLNLGAATVISAHTETLEAVIALAIFLPIVSDMSGCSGNQAVAVSIRELSLGVTRPGDFWRVFRKEFCLGVINGIVLGIVLGGLAGWWQGNLYLGFVIGGALALNTVLSVVLGGLVPLVLKRFSVDPALASGPLLTTCTDMAGFFLVLSLAGALLSRMV